MIPYTKREYELPTAGVTAGRLYSIVDIGTHTGSYMGAPRRTRKLKFLFELPNIKYTKGDHRNSPFKISRSFTVSMHVKSGLRIFIENWRAKKFSETEADAFFREKLHLMVGQPAVVNIAHEDRDDSKFANIVTAGGWMKEMGVAPAGKYPQSFFVLVHKYWNPTDAAIAKMEPAEQAMLKKFGPMSKVFNTLDETTKKSIMESEEYPDIAAGKSGEDAQPDAPEDHEPISEEEDEPPF